MERTVISYLINPTTPADLLWIHTSITGRGSWTTKSFSKWGLKQWLGKQEGLKQKVWKKMKKVNLGSKVWRSGSQAVKYRVIGDLAQQSEFLSLQQLFSTLQRRASNLMRREKQGWVPVPTRTRRSRRKYETWRATQILHHQKGSSIIKGRRKETA